MTPTFAQLLTGIAAAAALLATPAAQAGAVTVGSLTRDTATTISDSLNNRTWLGWDVVKGMTYAQTQTAIGTGGMFEGYKFARNNDAQLFVDALLGPNLCNTTETVSFATNCGMADLTFHSLVGDSFFPNSYSPSTGEVTGSDSVFFLSDNDRGQEVGELFGDSRGSAAASVGKRNEAFSVYFTDLFGGTGRLASTMPTGWLLYRDNASAGNGSANAVPEPGTLALTGLALLAALGLRRKA